MKSVKTTKSCTHHTVAHTASEQHNGKRRIRILSQLLTRHKHLNVHIFMCAQRTACPTYLCGYMLQCTSTYTHTDAHAFANKPASEQARRTGTENEQKNKAKMTERVMNILPWSALELEISTKIVYVTLSPNEMFENVAAAHFLHNQSHTTIIKKNPHLSHY